MVQITIEKTLLTVDQIRLLKERLDTFFIADLIIELHNDKVVFKED